MIMCFITGNQFPYSDREVIKTKLFISIIAILHALFLSIHYYDYYAF